VYSYQLLTTTTEIIFSGHSKIVFTGTVGASFGELTLIKMGNLHRRIAARPWNNFPKLIYLFFLGQKKVLNFHGQPSPVWFFMRNMRECGTPYHITCTIYVIWYGITYSFNITLIYLAGLIWWLRGTQIKILSTTKFYISSVSLIFFIYSIPLSEAVWKFKNLFVQIDLELVLHIWHRNDPKWISD